MDPQERLLLETAWAAMEDGGYDPHAEEEPRRVGVFVGVMWNEYQLLLQKGNTESIFGQSNNSSLANRISYYLNLCGPSLVIDTACSSSLVAVHMACENIMNGECDYALAGGVNLSLHPSKYINLSQAGMLASDGHCHSFGEGGDGYVPGEGVGMVLLKSLSQALRDGDTIYGVIKGSHVNHGGKTHGYTVPSPDAQGELIVEALKRAGVEAKSISYIEAHGTGTPLGDPIEITGLCKAFGEGMKKQSCPIGSVKSNVGHLEGAAGIVALTKIILQLKHKQLVSSIYSEKLNTNINFEQTPFYVQHELSEWKAKEGYKRRAGISSFGAGGTNAYVIIEEAPDVVEPTRIVKPAYLITLSGKTEDALKQRINNLAEWLEKHKKSELEDISFTLNANRSHFDQRCGLVVSSLDELQTTLQQLSNNQLSSHAFIHIGSKNKLENQAIFKKIFKQTMQEMEQIDQLSSNEYRDNLLVLANFYAEGYDLDWERLHQGEAKRRISLPTYPFAKERYWVEATSGKLSTAHAVADVASLHPLIDANTSTLALQSFTKLLTQEAFYLHDHRVNQESVLPGVAYLEMAREAGLLALPHTQVVGLKNIVWVSPIRVSDKAVLATITLYPEASDIKFEVTTPGVDEPIVNAQGKLFVLELAPTPLPAVNISAVRKRCTQTISQADIYARFNRVGLHYGKRFQVIQTLQRRDQEVLAELQLPSDASERRNDFILHPSLLDGALQAAASLNKQDDQLYLPFLIDEIIIYKAIPDHCYAYVIRCFQFN